MQAKKTKINFIFDLNLSPQERNSDQLKKTDESESNGDIRGTFITNVM